jgi:hypothetical protein
LLNFRSCRTFGLAAAVQGAVGPTDIEFDQKTRDFISSAFVGISAFVEISANIKKGAVAI